MFRYTFLLYLCCCWLVSPSLCHRKKKIKHLLGLMLDNEHRTTHAPHIPHSRPRPPQPSPTHHHFNMVMAPDEQPAPSKVVSSSSSLGKEYEGTQKPATDDNDENHQTTTTEKTYSTNSEYGNGNGNEGNGYGNNGNGYWNSHGNNGNTYNNGENGYGYNYGNMGNWYGNEGNGYKNNNNGYGANDNGQNSVGYNGNGNGIEYQQYGNGNGYNGYNGQNGNGYENGKFRFGKNHGNGYNAGYQYGSGYDNGYQNNNYQFNKNYYNNDNQNTGQNNYDYGKSYNHDYYKDYDSHGGYGGYGGHGNSESSYQRDGFDDGGHSGGIISRFSHYIANLFSDPGSVLVTAAALSLKALVLNLVLVAMNRTGRRKRDLPLRGGIYSATETLDELMKQMRNYVQDANVARACLDRIACKIKNKLARYTGEKKSKEGKLQFDLPFVFNVSGINLKSHYQIEKKEESSTTFNKFCSFSSDCPRWLFKYFLLLPEKWLKQLIEEYEVENGT